MNPELRPPPFRVSSGARAAAAIAVIGTLACSDPPPQGAPADRARTEPSLSTDGDGGTISDPLDAPEPVRDPRLEALLSGDLERTNPTLDSIRASRDRRYVAPLIELVRAFQIGLVDGIEGPRLLETLEETAGVSFGEEWPDWMRWLARQELETPEGFTGWKGRLLSRIDPRFGALLAYGMPSRIRLEEIVWGGVRYEGIPSLDDPPTVSAAEAEARGLLRGEDAVFGLAIGDQARAYPLRILDWHEMANDSLGGVPIALAYCTLCGSGIAYDRRTPDGLVAQFGSSGLLMRSNKLMVDRATRSLWNQLTGEPVVGPWVDEPPFRLRVLPSVVTTWDRWRERHPESDVVSFETGFERDYSTGAAYADYFASPDTMFPVATAAGDLEAKARVVGIELDDARRAFPLEALARDRVRNERVGATPIVLVSDPEVRLAGTSLRSGARREYSAGAAVRAYRRGDEVFRPGPITAGRGADRLLDERGGEWSVDEDALVGPEGQRLARVPVVLAYRFGWESFFAR